MVGKELSPALGSDTSLRQIKGGGKRNFKMFLYHVIRESKKTRALYWEYTS